AGPNLEHLLVRDGLVGDEPRVLGARADKAHLALEDVPALRQLVELRICQKPPEPRQPLVAGCSQRRAGRPVMHLPELEHPELSALAPHPSAAIEARPWAVEANDKRKHDDW